MLPSVTLTAEPDASLEGVVSLATAHAAAVLVVNVERKIVIERLAQGCTAPAASAKTVRLFMQPTAKPGVILPGPDRSPVLGGLNHWNSTTSQSMNDSKLDPGLAIW